MPDTIETSVRKVLTDDSAVTALVSSRIYPVAAPQSASKPFIVYEVERLDPQDALEGHGGLTFADFGLTCWASSYGDAKEVATAVRDALLDYNGTSDNIKVHWSRHDNSRDTVVWPDDGTELPVYGVEQDWRVAFSSTKAS